MFKAQRSLKKYFQNRLFLMKVFLPLQPEIKG